MSLYVGEPVEVVAIWTDALVKTKTAMIQLFTRVPPVNVTDCLESSPTAPFTGVLEARNILDPVKVAPVEVFLITREFEPEPTADQRVASVFPVASSLLNSIAMERFWRPPMN